MRQLRLITFWVGFGLPLASCSNLDSRYCETEERIIPESEWTARALAVLWQEGGEHLPEKLKQALRDSPAADNNVNIQKIVKSYILENNDCCDVEYQDNENIFMANSAWRSGVDPVAVINLYVTETHNIPLGVNSCGDKVLVMSRG